MSYAKRTYTPGSSTTTFALTTAGGSPIGYIQESDITVKVNGTTYTNAASGTSTYQISGSSTVEQPNGGNVVLNAGVTGTVILERVTAFQDATVVYTAGSTLTSTDLNNADNQIRFSLQEFDDKYASLTSGTGTLPDLGAFLGSSDTWVSNNSKAATSAAIDARSDTKIATALTGDVVGTAPVTIADNSPSSGKITIAVDAKLTELSTMAQATANALADLTQSEVEILDGITATTAEINYVDGVTSNVQTQLDAKQGSATDLTTLSSCQTNAASALAALTQAEVQILDGATVSSGELNVLDGIPNTLSATELGYVDGVTSSIQTQLNAKQPLDAELTELATMSSGTASSLADLTGTEAAILDGATLTVTELNYVDGVTSAIQTQLDAKQPLDSELTTLAGMQGGTASILASGTALGATTAEINSICENRAAETSVTNDAAKIPTSSAVVTYVTGAVTAVGGFVTVATEVTFPNSQPDADVVVSVADAGGLSINSSGVASGATTAGGAAVTITGIPNALHGGVGANANPNVLAAGVGLQLVSSGSSDSYAYHKLLATESDVAQLSGDINDFNERYRVSNGAPSGTDHAGDLYYDTGSDKMLVRNAANNAWEEVQSIGNFYINTISSYSGTGGNSASFNGSAYRFVLSNAPTNAEQLLVSINGVVQKPNSGTSQPAEGFAIDGSSILFSSAPATSSPYFIITIGSAVNVGTPSNNTVSTAILQNGSVTNDKVNASAAIAGSKISPDFGSQAVTTTGNITGNDITANGGDLTVSGTTAIIHLTDTNNNDDFSLMNEDGNFRIRDATNGINRLNINSDGDVAVTGNLDVGAGVDVTGNITVTGTVDGVDIAALNTTVGTKAVLTGSTNNTIATVSGANALVGEAKLTFDGDTLKFTHDAVTGFDSNSQDFLVIENGDSDTYINIATETTRDSGLLFSDGTRAEGYITYNHATDDLCVSATDDIWFRTAGSERFRVSSITTSGSNEGIGTFGTHSWGPKFQVLQTQGAAIVRSDDDVWGGSLHLAKSRGNYSSRSAAASGDRAGAIYFEAYDGTDWQNYVGGIECFLADTVGSNDTPGYLTFSTANDGANTLTVRARIDSDGLKFNTDTAAANALSDYEEGTWTPTIEGSSGKSISTNHSATYVKIGRLVHCQCYIVLTGTGNSSVFLLGTLPFTNKAHGYSTNVTDFGKGGKKGAYARVNAGTTYAEFLYSSEDEANDRVTIKGQDVGNGYLITTIQYMTDS